MAQVPYSPVPQVAPQDSPTPRMREDSPVGAFGGQVASAVENLGAVTERAGNELFGRAVALQQLNNETEAREADAQYMIQAGGIHAQFNALQGQERVAAYPKYAQDLQDLRLKLRGGLSNQMAQKMYDSSSLSTMGRSIFNGAGAAASAQKEAALGAASAKTDLLTKSTFDDPNDEGAFRSAIDDVKQTATLKAATTPGGASAERVELLTRQGISTVASNRILGMARNQPAQAAALLDQYKKEGLLFGKDYEVVSNKVQSLTQTVGTNIIANQVLGKYLQSDGTYSKSASEMQAEAVDQATKAYPDDPKMGTAAQAAFDHNYNQHQWAAAQDERARKQQAADYIVKGVTEVGQLPPDLQKRMTPTEIKAFPAQANSYLRAEQTQTNEKQYRDLLGMYNNDNAKFMDQDIMRMPGISKGNMDFFLKLQRTAAANGDPRVSRAMNWIKGASPQVLDDLGITGPRKDRDTSNQFVGALHEAIQSYQEENGKPPNEQQVTKEIFPAVTRQVTQQGWLWNSQVPFFSAPLPEKYKEEYLKINPQATEPEIRRDFSRQMFDQFFKGSKASKDQSKVQ